MSKISCDIIQDMLPLYYDEVCSADSRKMIEEEQLRLTQTKIETCIFLY